MSEPDVLIVGGGVIGLTTAYFLARAGARVTVADQGDLGHQASWAGAGIISPADPARARIPFDLLRARSCALFPDLSRALLEETGIDNGYFVCGGLEIPEEDEDAPTDEWRGEGITFTRLDEAGLHRLEPRLAPGLTHGYHLPHVAQVRNPRHLQALIAACQRRGVTLLPHCPIRSLVRGPGRILAVQTDSGSLAAGRFVVAAGAWTEGILGPLGWRPGPRPILLVGKRYLVPRADGLLLVGSTEEDAGFDAHPTGGGIAGLLAFAVALVPALAGAPLERCWAGLRPGSPDGLPYLGAVPGWDNLFIAAGHFRSGIQLSPGTGLVLSEVLTGRPPSLPLEPFRLDRPGCGVGL